MKTKLLLSLFAVALLAFNFSFKSEKAKNGELVLQNVALMQANHIAINLMTAFVLS
ncbi:MAG: hypothetical protein LBJ72_14965 [Dysgonamonadaceae bacterium]|jgi:hypothetical protein|nr:hypothetical protein [Dysgonamonadaceae bacterium]